MNPSHPQPSDDPATRDLNQADLQAQIAALSEIMQAISAAQGDEKPIFQTILKNAQSLCNAPMAALISRERNSGA